MLGLCANSASLQGRMLRNAAIAWSALGAICEDSSENPNHSVTNTKMLRLLPCVAILLWDARVLE
eukprot:4057262-Amphidinium_carterae.1